LFFSQRPFERKLHPFDFAQDRLAGEGAAVAGNAHPPLPNPSPTRGEGLFTAASRKGSASIAAHDETYH
jgi:hypothetical protein